MKLQVLTRNRFSCFFEQRMLKDEALFSQFQFALGEQFATMQANQNVYNNRDFMMQVGD